MKLKTIKKLVEERTNINLLIPTRKRKAVYARAIYFKLAREKTHLSLKQIGESLNKDHATVLHSINNIFEEIKKYDSSHYSIYKELLGTEKLLPMNKRFLILSKKHEDLQDKLLHEKYDNIIEIVKRLPDNKLDVAEIRFKAIADLLDNKN
ncbi:MAG: putative bacterial DnaA helix-turn-helix protein [Prokaryotic dsDNA virus sp.]|nr:MAG: putative bacterial DnaA helix-turn-helix protein [Prokaryotic dsDNA virus sp.]|tara:strand:+ start:31746 stop:32198 length:453 start_codon:yes stop_codon:yes gene_type:complete